MFRHHAPVTARAAVATDIAFLAEIEEISSTPPFPRSTWALCLDPVGTPVRVFAEAMYAEGASRWGGVEDFIVLEAEGRPLAACAVYEPAKEEADRRTFRLERLPAVAARLGWSEADQIAFRHAYDEAWGPTGTWLEPHAPAIVEVVGVLPAAQGLGLGKRLMTEAFAKARARGHRTLGVSVYSGNDGGRRLYESTGFEPLTTWHAAFFGGAFPGFTKLVKRLDATATSRVAEAA